MEELCVQKNCFRKKLQNNFSRIILARSGGPNLIVDRGVDHDAKGGLSGCLEVRAIGQQGNGQMADG